MARQTAELAAPFCNARELTKAYCRATEPLMLANAGRQSFWYSFIASRDRHVSRTFDAAHEIAAVLRAAAASVGQAVEVTTDDPLVVSLLLRCRRRLGLTVEIDLAVRLRAQARRLTEWGRSIAVHAWRIAGLVRAIHRAGRLRGVAPAKADVLVFTLFHAGRRLPDLEYSSYQDVYFGELPRLLAKQGKRVVLTGACAQGELPVLAHIETRPDVAAWLRPLIIDAKWWDLVAALAVAYLGRRTVPALPLGAILDLAPLVRRDLAAQRDAIFVGALLHRVVRRVLARYPKAQILHVYENNAWERSTYSAVREQGRYVVGYLHCAVLPGHLKNYAGQAEWSVRPHPDRIVTTGPAAKALLEGLGDYPDGMVVAGAALRDAPMPASTRPRPAHPGRILVLLEGLVSMARLLALCHAAALAKPSCVFVVRAHPDLPTERIARDAGFDFASSPLQTSEYPDLREDISLAQVVLYQGTTAAITAGLMPRPLIRAALDARVDDDPLSGLEILKWQVDDLSGLLSALDAALACTQEELEARAGMRADHILRRWAPLTQERLQAFEIDPMRPPSGLPLVDPSVKSTSDL